MEFIRTPNAIERLHEEFKRHIKTQTVLPYTETAAMLFLALLVADLTMCAHNGDNVLAECGVPCGSQSPTHDSTEFYRARFRARVVVSETANQNAKRC